jgi:hypothetical protein
VQSGREADDPETERIREEIEGTRAEMSETIDAIQERLSPDRVVEQVKEQVRESVQQIAHDARASIREATVGRVEHMVTEAREKAEDVGYGLIDRIKENPVPAAIAGFGLAWLLFGGDSGGARRRRDGYRRDYYGARRYRSVHGHPGRYYDEEYAAYDDRGAAPTAGGAFEEAQERVGRVVGEAQEQAGRVAGQVREQAESLREDAQEQLQGLVDEAEWQTTRARYRFDEMMSSSPLALGAIALGLGAAVGLAVPSTERENEWLGEARDGLMGRAKEAISDVGEQARRAAEEAFEAKKAHSA